MKHVAIIGANSYIARNLYTVLSDQFPGLTIALYDVQDQSLDQRPNYTSLSLVDGDLSKLDLSVDTVFFFTGKTGTHDGFTNYEAFIDINEKALLTFLNAYVQQGSQAKIIFPSTRLVYRGADQPLAEDAPKEFKTVYAINKFACEQYLDLFHRNFGVNYAIVRLCLPYGTLIPEASSYGTAEFMIRNAKENGVITLYGDGSLRRTLTSMEDLCDDLIQVALSEHCKADVYNIGGEDYSLLEMANLIAKKYGAEVTFVPWPEQAALIESGSTVFDSTKLDQLINKKRLRTFADWARTND